MSEMEQKSMPEAEVKLAQELCAQMGECSATYYIVLLLGERERLMRQVGTLQDALYKSWEANSGNGQQGHGA